MVATTKMIIMRIFKIIIANFNFIIMKLNFMMKTTKLIEFIKKTLNFTFFNKEFIQAIVRYQYY